MSADRYVLTDTHTHLYYERDKQKRHALMQRCFDNHITRLFLPNVDTSSLPMVYELAAEYPENCFPMIGLHPCDVKESWEEQLLMLEAFLSHKKAYAIGEIGIDLHWDKSTLAIQQKVFRQQIAWAKAHDLPIVIHCREAYNEVLEILHDEKGIKLRGILHCFTGTIEQARELISLGFYLGIGGVVTYKNSGLDKVVEQLSIENLVLETDSPYLAPVPFRGKPNESSYLIHIAQKIADIKQIDVNEVADFTTKNSKVIFGR